MIFNVYEYLLKDNHTVGSQMFWTIKTLNILKTQKHNLV